MRLLIVDDHEVVRRGVRSLLSEQRGWDVCGEAVDGQDAIEKARELKPDLIVMDVSMPRLNGLEATRQVRSILPSCEVLVLSQHDSNEMARQALNAGARGYVVKSSISRDLIAAVVKVSQGNYFFDTAILNQIPPTHTDVQEILQRSVAFQKALRDNEELYRSTFELTAAGIAHVSPDGRWLRVNKKFCDIVGYSESELLQRTFRDITHPEDLAADSAQREKIKKREITTYSMDKRYIRKDGSPVWTNLSVAGAWDESGTFRHFITVVEDISRRKAAESSAHESERRLRNLTDYQSAVMNNMAEGLYALDANGLVTSINRAGEAILGWTRDELLGKKMHDVSHYKHPDGSPYPASECPGLQVVQQGIALREHEDTFIRKDGSFVPVVFSASPLEQNGKIAGVIVSFRDDTEQRRAREALLHARRELEISADHLQLVTQTMAASVTRCSKDLRYLWANQGYANWLKQSVEDIIGKPIAEVLGKDAFEKLLPYFERVLSGERVSYEAEVVFRSIGTCWISAVYIPTLDATGTADGWIAAVVDITERKRAEDELRESKEQLLLALQSSKSAMFDWDVLHNRGNWNPQMAALYGFQPKREYITAEEWITLFHPGDVDRLRQQAEHFWAAGDEFYFEFRTAPRNGTVKWISSHGRVARDSNGKALRMIGTHSDITDRKLGEFALSERARQQKALFHLADELHRAGSIDEVFNASLNAILDALQCNRASVLLCDDTGVMRFRSWRGLSKEYRAATDGHSAWRPGDKNPLPVCINDINTADLHDSLKAVVKKEGIGALAFIPLVSNGKLMGKFMAYFNKAHEFTPDEIDLSLTIGRQLSFAIDRRRNAEALDLARADARFRSLLDSAPDAMVVTDNAGKIILVNSQTEKVFGYKRDELLGREVETLMPIRFRHHHLQHRRDFASAPRFRAMGEGLELFGLHKDGREFPVEISLSPLETEHGVVFTSAIRDITQRKAAQDEARQLSARLLQMQDEERRRLARELHDSAGQTITALIMNIDQLKSEESDGARARLLSDSDTLLQNLSKELRTMSHLLHPPLLDEVGLSSALQWFVDGFAQRSSIATTLELAPDFGRATPELEIAIFRIVQECLTNVHRHSGSSKAIVRLKRSQDALLLEIQDEGKGIAPEKKSALSGSGPIGVGLRGMRERVVQLRGTLEIESGNTGTTVRAMFPIAKPASVSPLEVA
jgi:PAS domain S-box-containing protein